MHHYRFHFLLCLVLLLKSCDIPDAQPFTKSTRAMGAAIDGSLKRVAADADFIKLPNVTALDKQNQATLTAYRQQLGLAALHFSGVAHAFDAYAQSLDTIAAVGKARGKAIDTAFTATTDIINKSKGFLAAALPPTIPITAVAGPILKALKRLADDLNKAHTIHSLSQLASPQQDSIIQLSAQLLHLGLKRFYAIDSTVYRLRDANLPEVYSDTRYWYQFTSQRQGYAIKLLAALTQAEKLVRTNPADTLENAVAQDKSILGDGPIDRIAQADFDPQHTVLTAYANWLRSPPATGTAYAAWACGPAAPKEVQRVKLLDALRQRELFYRALAELPQAYLDAAQAKYGGPPRDAVLITKSQLLLDTWASSHHELRLLLAKASKVTRQDVVSYAETVKTLADELRAAKK